MGYSTTVKNKTMLDVAKEISRGGARSGAGRKPKFKDEEETTTIAFRVPVSKEAEIKEKIDKILKKYEQKVKPPK